MIFYLLYRLGFFVAIALPLKFSYSIAGKLAGAYYFLSRRDKAAVKGNMQRIAGGLIDGKILDSMARVVFINFARYLVDFFRVSLIDAKNIRRLVRFEGLENIDTALLRGRGAILLSAHLGNWELGGMALSMIGYPVSAVVLTHQNRMINDFFQKQRQIGRMQPIEIGISLKACFRVLKNNGLLALLGDRDFSKNGIMIPFFGKETLLPKGPAVLSRRLGSVIVPSFMIRQPDDSYKLIFDEPIYPESSGDEDTDVLNMMSRYMKVIERYIRQNLTQWYVFRDIWSEGDKFLRADTII